jgi:hypothetical protein
MVTKHAFAVFCADKQIQRSIHDFAFRLQTRKLSRLSDQTLVYVDVGAGHVAIIHQFQRFGCMRIEFSRIELTAAGCPTCRFCTWALSSPTVPAGAGSFCYGEEALPVSIVVEE